MVIGCRKDVSASLDKTHLRITRYLRGKATEGRGKLERILRYKVQHGRNDMERKSSHDTKTVLQTTITRQCETGREIVLGRGEGGGREGVGGFKDPQGVRTDYIIYPPPSSPTIQSYK